MTKNHVKHRENLVKTKKTTGNRQNQKEDNVRIWVLRVNNPVRYSSTCSRHVSIRHMLIAHSYHHDKRKRKRAKIMSKATWQSTVAHSIDKHKLGTVGKG